MTGSQTRVPPTSRPTLVVCVIPPPVPVMGLVAAEGGHSGPGRGGKEPLRMSDVILGVVLFEHPPLIQPTYLADPVVGLRLGEDTVQRGDQAG